MSAPGIPDELRYEVKFVARATELHRLLGWVRVAEAGFSEPFPTRQVNNAYFDTYEHYAYTENIAGTSARSKVRYRWYGSQDDAEKGTLEVKRRRSSVGWKLSFPVGPVALVGVPWASFRRALRAQLPDQARVWLDANPQPVLINRYQRRYFVSRDSRVRLTVDWNQRVYDQRLYSKPNLAHTANLPDTLVVEVKFDREDRKLANRYVQGIPIRLSRNSKYVIGVDSITYD